MGDAASEASDSLHFLGLSQLLFGALAFCDFVEELLVGELEGAGTLVDKVGEDVVAFAEEQAVLLEFAEEEGVGLHKARFDEGFVDTKKGNDQQQMSEHVRDAININVEGEG